MKKRIFFKWKLLLVYLFLIIFIIGVIKFITGSFFTIADIYIEGDREKITNLSVFNQQFNYFFLSKSKIEKQIEKDNPLIKNIHISKKFPNALYSKIEFRQGKFFSNVDNDQIIFDEEGIILLKNNFQNSQDLVEIKCEMPKSEIGKQIEFKLELIKFIDTLSNSNFTIKSMSCDQLDKNILTTAESEIIFSDKQNLDQLASTLQFLFKQFKIEGKQPKTIDVRFSKPVLTY